MGKNFRKTPQYILDRIRTFDQDDIVVATVKLVRKPDISDYAHLGLSVSNGAITLPSPAIPSPQQGRYSKANVEGHEVVRKDLPMVSKEYGYWSPDWGDWSKGSHYVSWTRDVYQRDYYPPKEVELSVTLLETRSEGFALKFAIDQVLSRRTPAFESELFYNLNILQENVGSADVFKSDTSLAEFAASVRVDWQLFPPGTVDEVLAKLTAGRRPISPAQRDVMKDRIANMNGLKPEAYITGTDGFLRYFGAKFGDDFIVFENIRYGNAIYVLHENWQEVTKRSRIDLLRGPRDNFVRIEHRDGWRSKLRAMIGEHRKKAGKR